MSNANSLYLLADHIKLSLLERQRAKALNIEDDSQDGHISRSLDQLRNGLQTLTKEQRSLAAAGDEIKASTAADAQQDLQQQYDDLTAQFHGFSSPTSATTLTEPNDPALAADFAHASSAPTKAATTNGATSSTATAHAATTTTTKKTVRFSDPAIQDEHDPDLEAQRARLFNPNHSGASLIDDDTAGYRARIEAGDVNGDGSGGPMSNVQVHAYHQQILEEQDSHLDALGESISRQRELSMQIGDELDGQVRLLDEGERVVDRHQSGLDRARRQLGRVARGAGEQRQMVAIVVLIIILLLLIIVLK